MKCRTTIMSESVQHKMDVTDRDHGRTGFYTTLIVLTVPSVSTLPGVRPLDHPEFRQGRKTSQIPSDLVVKSQVTDIIDLLLQLVRHPNGVHRSCHHRKSRGAVLSTSAVQRATTKFDGVCRHWQSSHV